jgi:hypothetical protein
MKNRYIALLTLLVFSGFFVRFYVGSITDNADAKTLTWGAVFLAKGHLDPYKEVVKNSSGDPIPLDSIRSLSLAQGPLGLSAGALTLFVGEKLELISFPENNDGHLLKNGEIIAYKASYIIPEVIVLLCLTGLFYKQKKRGYLSAIATWAFSPLVFYTWGQGLPDTWVIAIMLLSVVLIEKYQKEKLIKKKIIYVTLAMLLCTSGALLTKLFPLILLPAIILIISVDKKFSLKQKIGIYIFSFGMFLVNLLPYLLSEVMRISIGVRFEFDLLYNSYGIKTGSALPEANIALTIFLTYTLYFFVKKNYARDYENYVIAATLLLSSLSGNITHLMVWSIVAIFLMIRKNYNIGVILAFTLGLGSVWYIVSYSWVGDILVRGIGFTEPIGNGYEFLTQKIGIFSFIGKLISAGILLTIFLCVYFLITKKTFTYKISVKQFSILTLSIFAIYMGSLFILPILGAKNGHEVWDFAYKQQTNEHIELKRSDVLLTELVKSDTKANKLAFIISRKTQPSLDILRFDVVSVDGEVLAYAQEKVYVAEPYSDRGYVVVDLNRTININNTYLAIRRIDQKEKVFATTVRDVSPFLAFESVSKDINNPELKIQYRLDNSNILITKIVEQAFNYKRIIFSIIFATLCSAIFVYFTHVERIARRDKGKMALKN